MTHFDASKELLEFIVDRVNIGVFILNKDHEVLLWNSFMASNSGLSAEQVVGKNLFESFPDLPERWFARKVNSVFMLKNFAFTSWEQRSHLFPFRHHRPVTSGMEFMCQDMTLMPIKNADGDVESVCIVLFDCTDTAIYRTMHQAAILSSVFCVGDLVTSVVSSDRAICPLCVPSPVAKTTATASPRSMCTCLRRKKCSLSACWSAPLQGTSS